MIRSLSLDILPYFYKSTFSIKTTSTYGTLKDRLRVVRVEVGFDGNESTVL